MTSDPPDFSELRDATDEEMAEAGMGLWDEETGLRLFPKAWFDHIPTGYEVYNIFGERFEWDPAEQSRDHRFGYLAYGLYPEGVDPS